MALSLPPTTSGQDTVYAYDGFGCQGASFDNADATITWNADTVSGSWDDLTYTPSVAGNYSFQVIYYNIDAVPQCAAVGGYDRCDAGAGG